MKALVCHLLPGSLYSIKVPFTHQSGLVYPLPPPSTLKGLLANALQRCEDIGPLEALAEVEREVRCLGAYPLSPIVLKMHIVSSVNAFERSAGGKATDALSRQFAFTHRLGVAVIGDAEPFLDRLATALSYSPVHLGDTESPVTCVDIAIEELSVRPGSMGETIRTQLYVPVPWIEGYAAEHEIYWVHTECWRAQALHPYLFPLTHSGDLLRPATIEGWLAQPAEIAEGATCGSVIIPPSGPGTLRRPRRRRKT
ncbi:MAG TPA: type I-A CRISPR-associated protein Cas5a [Alphaproteobacteria bacterium]|nr:type I-A CRISPR-associated protein Cas5a [Alphaproteobacteria bacterium]